MGQLARLYAARYTQTELETMLDAALSEAAAGKLLTSWSSLDASARRDAYMNLTPGSRVAALAEALCYKAPATYKPEEILPVTRTAVTFFDANRN